MFFDLLHLDGEDLLDRPAPSGRRPCQRWCRERRTAGDRAGGREQLDDALATGHEGVVVKALDAPYEAGRRGAAWVKVKPVHTLDLVVLAVEWGSGRRRGWLSNLRLGARDGPDGFVMLGKTFKGLTDEMLAWQTEALLALETVGSAHVVHVRPELVVEIAFNGVQTQPALSGRRRAALRPRRAPPARQAGGAGGHDRVGAGVQDARIAAAMIQLATATTMATMPRMKPARAVPPLA